MAAEDIDIFGEKTSDRLSIKEHLTKYFSYWPVFLLSLIICIGAGIFYTYYTEPKYKASTLILVKGNENSASNASNASGDLIEAAMNGKSKVNLDNEIQLMRSSSLMERVVARNSFNVSYFKLGKIRKVDLYLDAPLRLVPQYITDSNALAVTLTDINTYGGIIKYGPEKKEASLPFKWNQPLWLDGKRFTLAPQGNVNTINGNYIVEWNTVAQAAAEISSKLTVAMLDNKTTIIQLNILIENLNRGVDILNAVSREYNLSDIEDRNNIAQNSIRFIDERLEVVSKDLNNVEGNLENFQGNNKLIDVETQSTQSFENSNDVSKNLTGVNIQQGVVQMIQTYFNSPATSDKLVPSTLGLSDATLTSLITRFNELQLNKQREAPLVAVNSTVMADLNHQLSDVRGSIMEALQNITRNLRLQEGNLQQQNVGYRQFLSSLPRKERIMQEIKRKQSITQGIYLYLLQKREESAISSTSSTTANYRQIDPAKGYGPVEPNTMNIRLYTALLGLFLPIGFIYLKDALNDKINSRKDITDRVQLPVLGEISHISKQHASFISVMNRDIVAEQFRIIRTSLTFLLMKKDKQVILVTSSVSNEGKTLISTNLAAVLVVPDKRVALLEFDLRRPNLANNLGLVNAKGLTHYLSGQTNDLSEICRVVADIPNLHIYPAGPVPPNPGDMLLTENISKLFETLKQRYDYIIVDTAPAGLVSDAFVLSEYSDAIIYIVRQSVTMKKQLGFINEMVSVGKLNNIGLILNDVANSRQNGYDYNYSYGEEKKPSLRNRIVKLYK